MGHPGWTTVPQRAFLESRIPDYRSIQKTSAWPLFWKPLFDDWFKQWPTGADDPAKKEEDEDNMRRRLREWFWNHTRGTTSAGQSQGRTTLLNLSGKQRTRKVLPWQAYQSIYWEKCLVHTWRKICKGEIEGEAARKDDIGNRSKWVQQEYEKIKEDPVIKREVEKYLNRGAEQGDKDEDGDADPQQRHARWLQSNIDALSPSMRSLMSEIKRQTGLIGVIILGGPIPRAGGEMTTVSYSHPQMNGSSFIDWMGQEQYESRILAPMGQWLSLSFTSEERAQWTLPANEQVPLEGAIQGWDDGTPSRGSRTPGIQTPSETPGPVRSPQDVQTTPTVYATGNVFAQPVTPCPRQLVQVSRHSDCDSGPSLPSPPLVLAAEQRPASAERNERSATILPDPPTTPRSRSPDFEDERERHIEGIRRKMAEMGMPLCENPPLLGTSSAKKPRSSCTRKSLRQVYTSPARRSSRLITAAQPSGGSGIPSPPSHASLSPAPRTPTQDDPTRTSAALAISTDVRETVNVPDSIDVVDILSPAMRITDKPEWLVIAEDWLRNINIDCDHWPGLIDALIVFEHLSGYPTSKLAFDPHMYEARPPAISHWQAYGRHYEKTPPMIKDAGETGCAFLKWWNVLQPPFRDTSQWPYPRYRDGESYWGLVAGGGKNGMFLVILYLWWWSQVTNTPDERGEFRAAVRDVKWVLIEVAKDLKLGRIVYDPAREKERRERERQKGKRKATDHNLVAYDVSASAHIMPVYCAARTSTSTRAGRRRARARGHARARGRADDEHAHVQRAQCSAGSGVMGGGVQRAALRAARSERTGGAQRAGGRREASACACAGSGGVSSSVQQGLEGRGGAARSEGAGERRCGRQVAGGAKRKASGRVARSKHEGGTGPSGRECGNFRKARAEPDARGAEKADSTGQAEKPRKMISTGTVVQWLNYGVLWLCTVNTGNTARLYYKWSKHCWMLHNDDDDNDEIEQWQSYTHRNGCGVIKNPSMVTAPNTLFADYGFDDSEGTVDVDMQESGIGVDTDDPSESLGKEGSSYVVPSLCRPLMEVFSSISQDKKPAGGDSEVTDELSSGSNEIDEIAPVNITKNQTREAQKTWINKA
ncbi:hypothetical protein CERSUDRAFT_78405 [Gelatoporia subvermispora B]|uniref:Uncharacterized protein n=1 Tax=Ceriporiopsis subvermispora (strain B) TaxID=914234 RepID=M2QYR4_CERS8|nr:hypothetical protein CERSUDRAFT_78405 [Gelatoporia subvermispora B]